MFIAIFQSVLFLGHVFLYETWTYFWQAPDPPGVSPLQLTLAILSVSFLATSLLAFRYNNIVLRWLYTVAAIWLGAAQLSVFRGVRMLGNLWREHASRGRTSMAVCWPRWSSASRQRSAPTV